eukprot:270743_1
MSVVIQLASWAATAYLAYNFYGTATYVYSLFNPPQCDPSLNPSECFCGSYTEDTGMHFEVYLSNKMKLSNKFQSSNQFRQVYSSSLPPSSPIKISFDSESI